MHFWIALIACKVSRLRVPLRPVIGILGLVCLSFTLLPALGLAYFPRTDPGQFIINLKAATGTRIEITEQEVAKTEDLIRKIVSPHDLRLIVSNVGVTSDLSSIYTTNSSTHTAYIQVSLNDEHTVGSYAYIDRVRAAMQKELPELSTYFQTGGLVDAILNQGLPAPIDIQVSGNNLKEDAKIAASLRDQVSRLPGVADTYIREDVDAPSLQLHINRYYAQEMGLSEHEVVSNIITSLTSDGMISPSYWVDPKSGNLYMLTVQFPDNTVRSLEDLKNLPIRSSVQKNTTVLGNVASVKLIESPTEVDHYKLFRVVDVYVSTKGEELSRVASAVQHIVDQVKKEAPSDVRVDIHGIVDPMWSSLQSFGFGLILSLVLVYLVLVAQFRSFVGSISDSVGGSAWSSRRLVNSHDDRNNFEYHVVDGARYDGRNRRFQQYLDRRVYTPPGSRRQDVKGSRSIRGSRTAPPDFDDLSGNCYRVDPDGFGFGSRQRILRTAGTCDHRWITWVSGVDGIYRSLGGAAGLPEPQRFGRITGPPARTDTNALTSKADFLVYRSSCRTNQHHFDLRPSRSNCAATGARSRTGYFQHPSRKTGNRRRTIRFFPANRRRRYGGWNKSDQYPHWRVGRPEQSYDPESAIEWD